MKTANTLPSLTNACLAILLFIATPLVAHGMYDPKHGRWLQRDPLGVRPDPPLAILDIATQYTDGMDLYAYVGGKPIILVDPSGTGGCEREGEPDSPPIVTPKPPQRPKRIAERPQRDCCCCCVDDLQRSAGKTSFPAPWVGHDFLLSATLSYHRQPCDQATDCTVEWLEKTNVGEKPGVWLDKWAMEAAHAPTAQNWRHRKRTCPGSELVHILDKPAIDPSKGVQYANMDRTLEFNITLKSSPNCPPCKHQFFNVRAKQRIALKDGNIEHPLTWDWE